MKLLCSNLYIDESEGWADDAAVNSSFPANSLGKLWLWIASVVILTTPRPPGQQRYLQ
jgi:hypothetical protein